MVGTEYRVVDRRDTHFIFECQVDMRVARKGMVLPMLIPMIIALSVIIVEFSLIGGSSTTFMMIPIIIILAVFLPFILLIVAISSRGARSFTVELDKVSNKISIYTPNVARGSYRRLGQYFTTAWDLTSCAFQLIKPGEPVGPGLFILRVGRKNHYLVVARTSIYSYPLILLSTPQIERAQTLMGEIGTFLRGSSPFQGGGSNGGGEIPYGGGGFR